jgi:membrane-associated phospholipid phosphatase
VASNVRERFHLVDYMSIAFILVNIAFIVVARNAIENPAPIIGGYALCLLVTITVSVIGGPERYRTSESSLTRVARWLQGLIREAYPLALFAYFFMAVTFFDTAVFKTDLDPFFIDLETSILGSVPAYWLMVKHGSFLLSELLHGAYVLYYASIPGLAVWLYVRNRKALPEYITVSMFLFYATCLTYIFLPVVGGRFDPATKAMTEAYRYGMFTRIMAFIYRISDHAGAAFPSTHAIISIVIALVARRQAKPLAKMLAFNAFLIIVATVYCGYHYVADLVGALVYVAVLYPVALWAYRRYEHPSSRNSNKSV